jgi:hypothetical protein
MYQLPEIKPRKTPRAPYRKPAAVKLLEQLFWEYDRMKHPSVDPKYIARRKMRDDTANGLTACIVAFAKINSCFASRLNTMGVYDARLKKYRHTTQRRGLPDILITGPDGRSIFCEVKVKRDKMSEHQHRVQAEQQQSNGIYLTISTFTQFYDWFCDTYAVHIGPPKNFHLIDNHSMKDIPVQ